eukprot:g3138.t1
MTAYRFLMNDLSDDGSTTSSSLRLRVGRDPKGRTYPRRGQGALAYDPSFPYRNLRPPRHGLLALEVRTWHANLRDEECDALANILRHLHEPPTLSYCHVALDATRFCCLEVLFRWCCRCTASLFRCCSESSSSNSLPLGDEVRRRLRSAPLSTDRRLDRMRAAFGSNRREYTQRVLEDLMRSGTNLPVIDDVARPYMDGTYYPGLNDTFCGRPFVRKSRASGQKDADDDALPWTQTLRGARVLAPVRREAAAYLARVVEGDTKRDTTIARKSDDDDDDDVALGPIDRDYDETFGPLATKSLSGGPGSWKVCTLTDARGRPHPDASRLFPEALRLLERVPRRCGSACVSVLRPGARILLHRGPSNCRLTCHFGIIVPRGDLRIHVGTDSAMWAEGKWLVFDDAYAHSVENRTAGWRLVIIVDVWREELSDAECAVLSGRV